MSWQAIRPVALAAVRRENGEILVSKDYEPGDDEPFYRLIGGGVEFGEHSRESVVREFGEELDVELTNVGLVGTYENVFTFDGEQGHEIWRVYEGDIAEEWPYERDSFEGREPELDETYEATWMAPERLRNDVTFYDPAVLDDLN
ncbi:NUDIX hydrolase [Halococcus saccharolyticus]|uniref:NUDIX hydrolase n=1 Tax=Halococcus saccharolyticus DSM 5350 TaxID=1227455 RepID=M0MFH4_9EURY|nr:NUDIX domain-containing protein [Halococcus saccharolyticus]EMA43439.1 NUDIX hydrolase [Halococcus saccharolyticus DSM 5350]